MSENSNTSNVNDTDEVLAKMRDDYLETQKESIANNEYDTRDINRLKENVEWFKAFYLKSSKNQEETFVYLSSVLKWRKEINANELTNPEKLPFSEAILARGGYFIRNHDKDGVPILHVISRVFRKGEFEYNEICKFIAYHFEKVYKFNTEKQLICLFDLNGSGMSNYDMEVIKFMVNCLKTYYPLMTSYVMVFNAPFIFQAIWQVIKMMVSTETAKRVKFVDKRSIKEFIADDQLLTSLGGTDDYKP